MKLNYLIVSVFLALVISNAGFSQGISGSSHDFSGSTWNSTTEICIVCHTPHGANLTVTAAPLWNHQVTAVAAFQLYTSATLNATVGQPDGSSKLCLSCHDGTIALENFASNAAGTHFISNFAKIGTDLRNDHPISFTYDAALASTDGGLWDPTTHVSGVSATGTINSDMLYSGKLQCASCHDVHNKLNLPSFLRKDNTGSALCLTCHNK